MVTMKKMETEERIQGAAAVTHSLKYFLTGSSQVPNFPEFVVVGMVDDVQIDYYDSNTEKAVPKQDWIAKNTDQQHWESQTAKRKQWFTEILKECFNQTGGVHIVQRMYGCEWDEKTGEVNGYRQDGYDGEDFISFDLKTETWVAAKQQAHMTKIKLDNDRALTAQYKNYFTQECPELLKKYVNYGRSSLMKTVVPKVSLLQKSSSSPVTCHATGFYPNRAEMVWKKDGVKLDEGVDKGEILTNNDGTFQMSVDLDLRSVPAEDWYDCVFQFLGVNEDIVTRLDKAVIRTNEAPTTPTVPTGNNFYIIIAIFAVVLVLAVIGIVVYRKKKSKCSQPPMKDPAVKEPLNPAPIV